MIDPKTCDEARTIAEWWSAKTAGIRDIIRDMDELPFTDEDYNGEESEETV